MQGVQGRVDRTHYMPVNSLHMYFTINTTISVFCYVLLTLTIGYSLAAFILETRVKAITVVLASPFQLLLKLCHCYES